ncbi:hypothetical protein AOQ84DRAFT_153372 [Glonium stellatum]|uniref:Transmembrane protein n=1 Tax=Glonium stellatum TaxID=574774 RepID=A0A8E2JN90_9PEZI|nr:hypothetical protein AOQ84DRAFT_153372 [Glonium stellatum]
MVVVVTVGGEGVGEAERWLGSMVCAWLGVTSLPLPRVTRPYRTLRPSHASTDLTPLYLAPPLCGLRSYVAHRLSSSLGSLSFKKRKATHDLTVSLDSQRRQNSSDPHSVPSAFSDFLHPAIQPRRFSTYFVLSTVLTGFLFFLFCIWRSGEGGAFSCVSFALFFFVLGSDSKGLESGFSA